MRPFIQGFVLFCLWAVFARWYYVCQIKHLCNEATAPVPSLAVANTLGLTDGDSTILSGYPHFMYKHGESVATNVVSDKNNSFLQQTADYLKAHPNKTLTISGYYRESEKDIKQGFFENIGLARAAALRARLVEMGVSENRISLDYKMLNTDDLSESAMFVITEKTGSAPASFTFTNMSFTDANFESGSAVFRPSEQFQLYSDSLKQYFVANPNKSMTIIGHTDSDGDEKSNYALGKARAAAVKQWLLQNTILRDGKRISTDSKGETAPVAPNDTPEGKLKNRRVNIRIE